MSNTHSPDTRQKQRTMSITHFGEYFDNLTALMMSLESNDPNDLDSLPDFVVRDEIREAVLAAWMTLETGGSSKLSQAYQMLDGAAEFIRNSRAAYGRKVLLDRFDRDSMNFAKMKRVLESEVEPVRQAFMDFRDVVNQRYFEVKDLSPLAWKMCYVLDRGREQYLARLSFERQQKLELDRQRAEEEAATRLAQEKKLIGEVATRLEERFQYLKGPGGKGK
jgi:hypothetical protein